MNKKEDKVLVEDYDKLELKKIEEEKLNKLFQLSNEKNYEFAICLADDAWTDFFTNNEYNRVNIPKEIYRSSEIFIYHSHRHNRRTKK